MSNWYDSTISQLYPFTGGVETAPWPPSPIPTTSTTNAEGQIIDAAGNPIPPVSGGALPTVSPAAASAMAQGGGGGQGNALLQALRGIQAPKAPDVVKPSTPAAPVPARIPSGGLVQMLNMFASLGIGPRDVFQMPKLPGA